jgi:hypothetical protein
MWFEGLEDASRYYFSEHDPEAVLTNSELLPFLYFKAIARLKPLHDMLEKGPETLIEAGFQKAHGRDLQEAMEWIQVANSCRVCSVNLILFTAIQTIWKGLGLPPGVGLVLQCVPAHKGCRWQLERDSSAVRISLFACCNGFGVGCSWYTLVITIQ